jgi:hypothetical protein
MIKRVALFPAWLLAGWLALAPGLARCQSMEPTAPPTTVPVDPAVNAEEAAPAPAPPIVLAKNLRLTIRPTLLGLVPPEDAAGYGQAFIRITGVAPDALQLHYEIKELVDSADGQAREWWQAPPEKPQPLTRIRRGEISVEGLAAARGMFSPLLWDAGGFTTQSSLLWLSRTCYTELATAGSTLFEGHCAAETPAPLAELLAGLLAERRAQAGLSEAESLRLAVVRRVAYPCVINGARLRLPAIFARDSAGLAEYWILDDAENPLVLKLSYLPAVNTQASNADQAAPTQPGGRDPRRPKLKLGGSVHTPPDDTATAQPVAGPDSGLAALVHEGGGYAVTSIDF